MKPQTKRICKYVTAAALASFATGIRIADKIGLQTSTGMDFVRSFIFIALIAAWGVSVQRRIVQRQVRRHLMASAAFAVFWLVVRTIKYFFITDPNVMRYLWYCYYIPMLFVPLMALFISMSLGKSESFRLPRWTLLLYVPTALLALLVLTNDLHTLVFTFPEDELIWTDRRNGYGVGCVIVIGWIAICLIAALVRMIMKCRMPRSRRVLILPFIPLSVAFTYAILYASRIEWLMIIAGDFTVFQCVMGVAIFESCILCGLIQSNMDYDGLFYATTISARITDTNFETVNASSSALPVSREAMTEALTGARRIDRDTILKGNPIRNGYAFWNENVKELQDTLDELLMTRDELRDTGDVLKAEAEQKARLLRIAEENRLYDMIEKQTAPQISLLHGMLERIRAADDASACRELLGRIVAVGTYIKRRSNLIFIARQKGTVDAGELELCLRESAASLELCGIKNRASIRMNGQLSFKTADTIYDFFEAVTEECFGGATRLLFFAEGGDEAFRARAVIDLVSEPEGIMMLFPDTEAVRDDDGLLYLTIEKGGERQ